MHIIFECAESLLRLGTRARLTSIGMLKEGDGERDKHKAPDNEVGRDTVHAGEYWHKWLSEIELIFDGPLLPVTQDQSIEPVPCGTCSLRHTATP